MKMGSKIPMITEENNLTGKLYINLDKRRWDFSFNQKLEN